MKDVVKLSLEKLEIHSRMRREGISIEVTVW